MKTAHPEPQKAPRQPGPEAAAGAEAGAEDKGRMARGPQVPDRVSAASFAAYCGGDRWAKWQEACTHYGIDMAPLIRTAGTFVNDQQNLTGAQRHLDARSHVRASIYDGIRAALNAAGTPDAKRPNLY